MVHNQIQNLYIEFIITKTHIIYFKLSIGTYMRIVKNKISQMTN